MDLALLHGAMSRGALGTAMPMFMLMAGGPFFLSFFSEFISGFSECGARCADVQSGLSDCGVLGRALFVSDSVFDAVLGRMGFGAVVCALSALFLRVEGIWIVVLFLGGLAVMNRLFVLPNNHMVVSLVPEGREGAVVGLFGVVTTRVSFLRWADAFSKKSLRNP